MILSCFSLWTGLCCWLVPKQRFGTR